MVVQRSSPRRVLCDGDDGVDNYLRFLVRMALLMGFFVKVRKVRRVMHRTRACHIRVVPGVVAPLGSVRVAFWRHVYCAI